jgi:Na+/melibiose symporter-like transporter
MLIFAMPRFGTSLLAGIVGLGVAELYIIGYNIPDYWGFAPIAIGYIAIAFSQFFFGWISDRWYTRWGRRKPWVVLLAPLSCISFILLYVPSLFLVNPSQNTVIAWLITWDVVFEFAYAVTTPYGAWMAEQFTIDERPKTSQIMNIVNFIGYGVMAIFTFVILTNFSTQLSSNPGVLPPTYVWSCIAFAIIFLGSYYLAVFLMPTEPRPTTTPNLWANLRNIFANKNYLAVVFMQGIASLAWITMTGVMLLYTTKVLGFSTIQYIIAGATLLIGIFIFLAVWRKALSRWGKKNTLLIIFTLAAGVSCCSLFGLVNFPSKLPFGLLFIAGIAMSLAGWYLLSGIWYADLAEDDAKRTNDMKAGLYGGFPSIILNLFQALGTELLALLLLYLPVVQVGNQAFNLGYVVWGPMIAIFLMIAYLFTRKFIHLDYEWQKISPANVPEENPEPE